MSLFPRPAPGRIALACTAVLATGAAQAVPSFARQTGSECAACHVGAHGLNLTPYGIRFKLSGYTDSNGEGTKIPLSAQIIGQHVNPGMGDNQRRVSEVDLYLAGRIAGPVGSFARLATRNDGTKYTTSLESVDVRAAQETRLFGREAVLGVSVNNTPTAQDPISALPGRGFGAPSTGGTLLNPSASVSLANRVLGVSAFGLLDKQWYGELGTYRTLSRSAQDQLGADQSGDPGKLGGNVYARLAWMRDWKTQFVSAGVVMFDTTRQPGRSGPSDDVRDLGYDLSYQYLGDREHQLHARYAAIFERRRYGSTPASATVPGLVARPEGRLQDRSLALTYSFRNTWNASLVRMSGTGSTDPVRFGPWGRPDTTSKLYLLSWSPFGKEDSWAAPYANLNLSAGWFRFGKFNGASNDVFGLAAFGLRPVNAKDLNSFTLQARVSF